MKEQEPLVEDCDESTLAQCARCRQFVVRPIAGRRSVPYRDVQGRKKTRTIIARGLPYGWTQHGAVAVCGDCERRCAGVWKYEDDWRAVERNERKRLLEQGKKPCREW
jgi:hypothetical protein